MKILFAIYALLLTGCSVTLPEEFNEYKFISSGEVSSESYEVIKLFGAWKGPAKADGWMHLDHVLYDTEKEMVLFDTIIHDYDKKTSVLIPKAPQRILWKINKEGVFVDSIEIDYSLSIHNSGMLYYNEYYIEWVNNEDPTKKSYTDVIDDKNLTFKELDRLIKKSLSFDVTIDYDRETTNIHLRHKSGLTLIRSKRLFDNTEGTYGLIRMPILKPYKENYTHRFIKIDTTMEKPENRVVAGPTYSIYTEYFEKQNKIHSNSLGDFNSNGRSGWKGIGYFKLEHNSEFIKFKGYAFNGHLDRSYMYHPIENNKDLAVIYLYKRASDLRPFGDTGAYVIRKKLHNQL